MHQSIAIYSVLAEFTMIFDMMEVSKKARITRNLQGVRIIGVSASEVKMHQSIAICSVLAEFTMIFDMMEVS